MKILSFSALLMLNVSVISQTYACLNSYTFEFGNQLSDEALKLALAKSHAIKNKSIEQLNDYAVLLIYDHKYQQAINILKAIEQKHPNLAKTAANLGTAYELNQQPEQAKYWIEQGIKRDAMIHAGSEWIHVKILDAQLQQKKDRTWIQQHDVLGLNFGEKDRPRARVKNLVVNGQRYDLDTILEHSKIQMQQRLRFVDHDPITAQILFNMANIEIVNYRTEKDSTEMLYEMAKSMGFHNVALVEARQSYYRDSKWYQFKAVFVSIARYLSDAIKSSIA